jgi:hypothetical protein
MAGDDTKPAPLELDPSFLTPLEPTPAPDAAPAPLELDPSALTPLEPVPAPAVPAPVVTPAPVAAPVLAPVTPEPAPVAAPAAVTPEPAPVAAPAAVTPEPASAASAPGPAAEPPPPVGGADSAGEVSYGDDEAMPQPPSTGIHAKQSGQTLLQPLDVDEWIPEKFRKHVDGGQPPPVRLMAARAMVPMPPKDMVHVVFQAMFDPEKKIAALAKKTFKGLDDKILNVALGDKLAPQVLNYFCKTLLSAPTQLEKVLLNRTTPDVGFCYVGEHSDNHQIIGIVAGNQERLLREHDIVRAIARNAKALRSELDRAIDFLVRQGVYLEDVDEFDDAFLRLGKGEMLEALKRIDIGHDLLDEKQQAMVEEYGVTPEELLTGNSDVVADIDAMAEKGLAADGGVPSGRRKPLSAYPIPVQIKLAMVGDHAAAIEAVHSTNRVVANSGIRNPKIRDSDIQKIVRSRSLADDVIRYICNNGDWTKAYSVKLALVQNPKTPIQLAMRWMPLLRAPDLKALSKSKQVPGAVQAQAKKMMNRKMRR